MDPPLSVVVPAFNEAIRLPPYLTRIRRYLEQQFSDHEVIVVDDGSTDGLPAMLNDLSREWPQLKIMRHSENRGKGAAVRTGMMAGRGERLLFADADGATPIEEEGRLRAAIDAGADIAVGSRLVESGDVIRQRTWARRLVGQAFARVARAVVGVPLRDTQCGFKMFRKLPATKLFGLVQEQGYLFDIELLILANHLGYQVAEVPISWSDVPGSRLSLTRESSRILKGLWRLRRRVTTLRLD
jgi:dolichyl-phosphate beta-glucosyltransferase